MEININKFGIDYDRCYCGEFPKLETSKKDKDIVRLYCWKCGRRTDWFAKFPWLPENMYLRVLINDWRQGMGKEPIYIHELEYLERRRKELEE